MGDSATSTTQKSLGKATVKTVETLTLMLWTGTDNYINLDTQDISKKYEFKSSPNKNHKSKYGPAFVLMPNGVEGYVVWADDATGRIRFSIAKDDGAGKWAISDSYTEIGASSALSGPTAALGLQNGQPVINVIWNDNNTKSLALSQIHIGHTPSSYPFMSLAGSSVDSPYLLMNGHASFLGYFQGSPGENLGSKPFKLAVDWKGGVNFDFNPVVTVKGRRDQNLKSQYAPAMVSRGRYQQYLVWFNAGEIQYIKMNVGKDNTIELDSNSYDSFDAGAQAGGVHAQLVQTPENGVITDRILVAWPARTSSDPADTSVYTRHIILPG